MEATKVIGAVTQQRWPWIGAAILIVVFSILIELVVRSCGFLMTPDSYNYISAAKSFKEAGLFLSPDGSHFTNWPPLFPIVLSFFTKPELALTWIQIICKMIIGLFIFLLAEEFLQNTVTKIVYMSAVFFSVHLLLIAVFLWSEIIFMTLLLAHIYLSLNETNKKYYYSLLLLTGFLLCLQRNAGLFMIVSTSLWFMLDKSVFLKKRLIRNLVYIIVCSSGLWFWHFYNVIHLHEGSAFYKRAFFEDAVVNLELILSCLGNAFVPVRGFLAESAGVVITTALFFFGLKYFKMNRSHKLLVLCLVFYTVGFVPIPNLDIYDMERYFAIILPVFLLFPLLLVERLNSDYPGRVTLINICLAMWLVYPVLRMTKNAIQWHEMSCSTAETKLF